MKKSSQPFFSFLNKLNFSIFLPSFILNSTSLSARFGSKTVFAIALLFPVGLAIVEIIQSRKISFFSIIGLVSCLLSILIFNLDYSKTVFAVKEAFLPLVLFTILLLARQTKYDFLSSIITKPIKLSILKDYEEQADFVRAIKRTYYAINFFFLYSAVANFLIVIFVIHSPFGTVEFNKELARLNFLNLVVITLPTFLTIIVAELIFLRSVSKITGATIQELTYASR